MYFYLRIGTVVVPTPHRGTDMVLSEVLCTRHTTYSDAIEIGVSLNLSVSQSYSVVERLRIIHPKALSSEKEAKRLSEQSDGLRIWT